MFIAPLILLLILNRINFIGTTPESPPVLKWYRSQFNESDTVLRFKMNQKITVSCEGDSHGTIHEVSERCFNSCSNEYCNATNGDKKNEFFTCNQAFVGPLTLRTISPNPNAVSFNYHTIHYFTSLDDSSRGGRPSTLCRDGMKFKIVVTKEVDEGTHRTTMNHPLFSNSHFHHPHHVTPSKEHTKSTTMAPIESTSMVIAVDNEKEERKEELIEVPMLTDKSRMSMEEMVRIDRLMSYPPPPYKIYNTRYDTKKMANHKFNRIDNTVMYNENGDIDQIYEVALPLGIDPNPSSVPFTFLSMAAIIFMLAIAL